MRSEQEVLELSAYLASVAISIDAKNKELTCRQAFSMMVDVLDWVRGGKGSEGLQEHLHILAEAKKVIGERN